MIFNGAIALSNLIKQKSPCVLQDIVPFRAAAQKGQIPTDATNGITKRGNEK